MSSLEKQFWIRLHMLLLEGHFQYEYSFHPTRKWRFDFADPVNQIAVECEGGTWTKGRHVRGKAFAEDCEKYNAAASMGWKVFRFPSMESMSEFRNLYFSALKLKEK